MSMYNYLILVEKWITRIIAAIDIPKIANVMTTGVFKKHMTVSLAVALIVKCDYSLGLTVLIPDRQWTDRHQVQLSL